MNERIRVLIFQPRCNPLTRVIDNTLDTLRGIVGGNIQAVNPTHGDSAAVLICNVDGKTTGLIPNRFLLDKDGAAYDCVFGTFLIAGDGDEEFTSLKDEQIQLYTAPRNKGDLYW